MAIGKGEVAAWIAGAFFAFGLFGLAAAVHAASPEGVFSGLVAMAIGRLVVHVGGKG
jgi:hypothetical protein